MNPNGNTPSTAATDSTPVGATVGASPAPEQQQQEQDNDRATATALSEILSPPKAEDTSGQQAETPVDLSDQTTPQPAKQTVPRDMRAVEARHKEDIRRAKRDARNEAMAELEGRFSAMLEAQLAPYRALYEQQAVASIMREYPNMPEEIAKELAQARAAKALTAQPEPAQNPVDTAQSPQERQRDSQGRFVSAQAADGPEADADADDQAAMQRRVQAKARQLQQQAGEIRQAYGIDMLALFQNDEEIKRGIVDEDRDFYWGLTILDRRQGGTRKSSPPPVVRTPNFTGTSGTSFADMPSDQFKQVQERLRRGERIDPRR